MKNQTTIETTNRAKEEKLNIALTLREVFIIEGALAANRHLFRTQVAEYTETLKQGWQADELLTAGNRELDSREKGNLRININICEQEILKISALIQEINSQKL